MKLLATAGFLASALAGCGSRDAREVAPADVGPADDAMEASDGLADTAPEAPPPTLAEVWGPCAPMRWQQQPGDMFRKITHPLLLDDGRIFGGLGHDLYDRALNKIVHAPWYPPDSGWSPRSAVYVPLRGENAVIAVGGGLGALSPCNYVDRLDFTTGKVTKLAPMRGFRHGHAAFRLPNGKILAVGAEFYTPVLSEIYDPTLDKWEEVDTPQYMFGPPIDYDGSDLHNIVQTADGDVFVGSTFNNFSCGDAFVYSWRSNTWATYHFPRDYGAQTAIPMRDGTVLLVGGHECPRNGWRTLDVVYVFDTRTGTFTERAPLKRPRERAAGIELSCGRVIIAGGESAMTGTREPVPQQEIYDPVGDRWYDLPIELPLGLGDYDYPITPIGEDQAFAFGRMPDGGVQGGPMYFEKVKSAP